MVSQLIFMIINQFLLIPPLTLLKKFSVEDFPGGTVDKNLPTNARDMGSVPELGRFYLPQSN